MICIAEDKNDVFETARDKEDKEEDSDLAEEGDEGKWEWCIAL